MTVDTDFYGGKWDLGCSPNVSNNNLQSKCSCIPKAVLEELEDKLLVKNGRKRSCCQIFTDLKILFGEEDARLWPVSEVGTEVRDSYRPRKDKRCSYMLTTIDLNQCLKQYESPYDDFLFVNTVPINFCSAPGAKDVCKFRLKDMTDQGKTKAAIVFNTDMHTGVGKHWIMLWVSIEKKKTVIAFFDSEGNRPVKNVKSLMKNLQTEANKSTDIPNCKELVNAVNKAHQTSGAECGVYCIYFVDRLLRGIPVESLSGEKRCVDRNDILDFMHQELYPDLFGCEFESCGK